MPFCYLGHAALHKELQSIKTVLLLSRQNHSWFWVRILNKTDCPKSNISFQIGTEKGIFWVRNQERVVSYENVCKHELYYYKRGLVFWDRTRACGISILLNHPGPSAHGKGMVTSQKTNPDPLCATPIRAHLYATFLEVAQWSDTVPTLIAADLQAPPALDNVSGVFAGWASVSTPSKIGSHRRQFSSNSVVHTSLGFSVHTTHSWTSARFFSRACARRSLRPAASCFFMESSSARRLRRFIYL